MGEIELKRSVDFMSERFQAVIKEFDSFKIFKDKTPVDVSNLEEKIKIVMSLIETLRGEISTLNVNLSNLSNSHNSSLQVLKNEFQEIKSQIDNHSKIFEEHKFQITNSSERIAKVEDKQSNFADNSKIIELSDELKNLSDKNIGEITALKSLLKDAVDYLTLANKNTLETGITNKELLLKKIVESLSNYDDLKKSFEDHKQSSINQISAFAASVSAQIEKAISSQPKPVIPSLEDAKISMKQILEPVSLDAKNANLRSVNTENEVIILKKKVESLILMMKKNELEGNK